MLVCCCFKALHSDFVSHVASRGTYSVDMTPGSKLLRPYQLGWRGDMGLSQLIDPEELVTLCELILYEGFPDSS